MTNTLAIALAWQATLLLALSCLSTVGNVLVIVILIKYPKVRVTTNMMIGSLALANLYKGIVYAMYGIGRSFGRDYVLGQVMCLNEHFQKVAAITTYHMSITCMVVGRFAQLFKRTIIEKARTSLIWLTVLWSCTFTFAFIVSRFAWISQFAPVFWADVEEHACLEMQRWGNAFWVGDMVLVVYLPLLLLITLYLTVWLLARRLAMQADSYQPGKNSLLLMYVAAAVLSETPDHIYFFIRASRADDKVDGIHRVFLIAR